jgi:hypothetical protein
MFQNVDELRTTAGQVKEMIAELRKITEVIGPNVQLKASGKYDFRQMGIDLVLELEPLEGGCSGCSGCSGCKGCDGQKVTTVM